MFFYGTLRHKPLLEIVLGRSLEPQSVAEAKLAQHSVHAAKGQPFPIIKSADTSTAPGLVARNLSHDDIARLNFYEGGFDYSLQEVEIETECGTERAEVYFPAPDRWQADAPWSLPDWQAQWGEMTCLAAEELMQYFGKRTAAEIDFMFPMIRARASVKQTAQQNNLAFSPSGFTRDDVTDVDLKFPYAKFFSIEEHSVQFRQYDGAQSAVVKREVFAASDAAIILPYDPVRDRVMLIEQFRPGPYARNDQLPWMLEPIAGRIDPGETPEQAATREAHEEAGLDLTRLHKVAQCYASPGCSTEYFFVYVAEADLPDSVAGIAGLDSEAEDIKSYLFDFKRLMELVDSMQAANAPLVLAALWLSRHRDRLRAKS
ncbi:tellurite resistance ADP-ribose pyrophosphatase TrgB [Cognatishimia sp. WU-CL00825]